MVDITHKVDTQRTATAQAIVKVSTPDTIAAIINKTVPKGDVLEVSRTAGLFAVKTLQMQFLIAILFLLSIQEFSLSV